MFKLLCTIIALTSLTAHAEAQEILRPQAASSTVGMARATTMKELSSKLIESFDQKTKKESLFQFDAKERTEWRYLPSPSRLTRIFFPDHVGTRFSKMTDTQKALVRELLVQGLSVAGVGAVDAAYELDHIDTLKYRGLIDWLLFSYSQDNYFISFFGKPGDENWAWKFEGHHISLNFTLYKDRIVSTTPTFIGTTTGTVHVDGQPIQVLAPVRNEALRFVTTLTESQLQVAAQSMSKVPRFTKFTPGLFSNKLAVKKPLPQGLSFQQMNESQKELILNILKLYQAQFAPELAQQSLAKVEAGGFENLQFVWFGDPSMRTPFYFRIQGLNFALEFTCSEGHADHYHTAWIEF